MHYFNVFSIWRLKQFTNKRYIPIWMSVAVVIIKFWSIFYAQLPWISDEVGVWEGAACILGYGESWRAYNVNSGDSVGYYGVISSLILVPIIAACNNSVTAYRFCLIAFIGLLVLATNIAYIILIKFFNMKPGIAAIISLASVLQYGVLYHSSMILTETVFTVWYWILLYYILKLIDNKNASIKMDSIKIAVCLASGYLIHSRCLIVLVIVFTVFFGFWLYDRKKLINYKYFFISFSVCIFLAIVVARGFQQIIWGNESASSIINTPELAVSQLNRIMSVLLIDIKGFGTVFISVLATFSLETCGYIAFALIIISTYLLRIFRKKEKILDKKNIMFTLITLGCFLGMIFCNSVLGHAPSRSKTYVYTRYATPFLGPMVLVSLNLLYSKVFKSKYILLLGLLCNAFVIHWCVWKWPQLLSDAKVGMFDSAFFLGYKIMSFINRDLGIIEKWIIIFFIFVAVIFLLLLLFIYKEKIEYLSWVILMASVMTFLFVTLNAPSASDFSENYYNSIENTLNCIEENDFENIPIYYYGTEGYFMPIQTALYKYNLFCWNGNDLEQIDCENSIFLTDNLEYGNRVNADYCFILADGEYLFTSNKYIFNILKSKYKWR